jgi:hypothetical protein
MCNLKYKIIPVIIRATRRITKVLRKNFEVIERKHSIDPIQKTAILGTAHIMWKVLQAERWGSSMVQEKYRKEKACEKRQR